MKRRIVVALSLVILVSTAGFAQSINLLSSTQAERKNEDDHRVTVKGLIDAKKTDKDVATARAEADAAAATQIAVPLGATAGLASDSEDNADVGAVLGFQMWKKDVSLLATFFSLSGADTINGGPGDFGSFLLNPNTRGNSFYLSGNRLWAVGTRKELLVGVSGRVGVTRTTWVAPLTTGEQSVDGFVGYLVPSFLLSSRTFKTGGPESNEYQFGLEAGPSLRYIGGDLAQADAFLSAPEVLGMSDHSFLGYEITFYARLNAAQPFVRITHFNSDSDVPGFTGTQAIIGVNVLSAVFKSTVDGS